MDRRAVALGLLGLVLALPASAVAGHCDAGIAVFARHSLTPMPTPYVPSAPWACQRALDVVNHEFSPFSDQVFLRTTWPFTSQQGDVFMELNGLGFDEMTFRLVRTVHPTGGVSYDSPEWLYMPDGTAASGELVATLYHPGGFTLSATYHKTAI